MNDAGETARQRRLTAYLIRRRELLRGSMAGVVALAAPGGRAARAAPSQPLKFIGWQYNPQIVTENVEIFKKLYEENVQYELVAGEYHALVETRLQGGQHVDMMYSEEDHLVRWHEANWTRDVEDLPGCAAIKAGMYPNNLRDLTLPNGKLGGLPYYSGYNAFVFNARHIEQAKLTPPATWEELIDQCRKLKRDKVSEYPYTSAWQHTWASLSWSLFSIWYSDGAKVFDKDGKPVFDDAFKQVLKNHRTLYAEGLVQPDIFTLDQESVPSFATGQHSYMVVHEWDQKVLNDPKLSRIAGAVHNALMPGKTRSTFTWSALYLMSADAADVDRTWNLMQFFGGKAKDGQYHVIKRWALDFGLGTPYREVIEDLEVQASFGQWKDLKVAAQQAIMATPRDVSKTLWFSDWDYYMMGEVQDYLRGSQSLEQLVDKLEAKVTEVQARYPQ